MLVWCYGTANATDISVLNVTFKQEKTSGVLTLSSTAPFTSHRAFVLRQPLRLVLDVDRVSNGAIALPSLPTNALIRGMRFGHFSPQASRFVLELNAELASYKVEQPQPAKGQPYQLIMSLLPRGSASTYRETLISASNPTTQTSITLSTAKPKAPSKSGTNPLIIIDAGHGGKDPGAIASDKVYEKNITLNYALALQKALLATGRYRVALTRIDDTFVLLPERVKIAREAEGDIMISLHADSALQKEARGLSIYTVSEEASDALSATLAQQENAADDIGEIAFANDNPDVADILIDLASRDTRIKATDLASIMVEKIKLAGVVMLKSPGRFAGFRVLKSPDVPSILVELGFLSNPHDEALLQNAAHRSRLIALFVSGIDHYFEKHPVIK